MPRIRIVTRWAIAHSQQYGGEGLYVGQWLTRKDAIYDHVRDKGFGVGCGPPTNDRDMRRGWAFWRKRGDRAVKTTITWKESPR